MQYSQDFDEKMVPCRNKGYRGIYDQSWHSMIEPYVKSAGLFRCPSNPPANTAIFTGGATQPPKLPFSYVSNGGIDNNKNYGTDGTRGDRPMLDADKGLIAIPKIEFPSTTLLGAVHGVHEAKQVPSEENAHLPGFPTWERRRHVAEPQ